MLNTSPKVEGRELPACALFLCLTFLPGSQLPGVPARTNKQASKPMKGAYHIPFIGLLWNPSQKPGFQGGGWAEQASKQATSPIGLWFFVELSTLIVLEPKANGRRTTDKGEATTNQGLPALALVRGHTNKAHIF